MVRKVTAFLLVLVVIVGVGWSQTTSTPAKTAAVKKARSTASQKKRAAPPRLVLPDKPVALNLQAGVYHCEGTSEFETYKAQAVVSQQQAVQKGFRAAFGKQCQ